MLSRAVLGQSSSSTANSRTTTANRMATSVATTTYTVKSIVDAAAISVDEHGASSSLVAALEATNIKQTWQLEQLSGRHWDKLNISMGLEVAIKVELAKIPHQLLEDEQMPDKLRQFLLMPGPDGKEAKPLSDVGALFMSILIVAPTDRQNLMIVMCELFALICGLLLALPLSFRRAEPATIKGWDLPPSIDDGMDALVGVTLQSLMLLCFFTVVLAISVASGGWRGSYQFYVSAMNVVGTLFICYLFGANFPLFLLTFWHLFTVASSPYPVIGAVLLQLVMFNVVGHFFWKYMLDAMPLEMYHLPSWFKILLKSAAPLLKARINGKALKPAAEQRAAELRARCGLTEPHLTMTHVV